MTGALDGTLAAVEDEKERWRTTWEPIADEAVEDVLTFDMEDYLDALIDGELLQAATDILVRRVQQHASAEKEKRAQAAARKAEEATKAKAREELAKKRLKERKEKEAKEKAELAALRRK